MKKKIIIIAGDPESINSEILFKSWKKLSNQIKNKIFVIASERLLNKQFKKLGIKISTENVKINSNIKTSKLKVIDVGLNFSKPFKILE